MVRNLMKAGFEVAIYARTKSKVEDVVGEGAVFHNSIRDCVSGSDVIITIVGFPKDVEDVYFAENNILASAKPGAYIIDMTSSSPDLAKKIYEAGKAKGFHVLDAPVTGGDVGARNATLSILVGGDKADFDACMPIFEAMGKNINYQGSAGCGQHAKLANQIMIAGTMAGVCEALTYAKVKGLDLEVFINSISAGAAGNKSLDLYGPRILKGDFAPGFFIKHFVKDMTIAVEESKNSGITLEILQQVLSNYKELADSGSGELGTQGLMKYYNK